MKKTSLLLFLVVCFSLLVSGCGKQRYTPQPERYTVTNVSGKSIVSTAKSQLGKPYRSGGKSPSQGFDCSGLVQWVYKTHGISIPRISKDQAKVGYAVSRSNLHSGDILVFKIPYSGYHTGIYIGNNQFIHSPKPKTVVRADSLALAYWKKNFLTARRIVRN